MPSCGWSAGFDDTLFDKPIRAAVDQWWADLAVWKLLKAQLFQESRLDPKAVSPVGAEGLGQTMPKTFRDISLVLRFPDTASPFDASYAIEAAAYYQAKMRTAWSAKGRTPIERNDLGLCAYNRGLGNCLRDQAECGGAALWPDIAVCTGRHTTETLVYVDRINAYWQKLELAP